MTEITHCAGCPPYYFCSQPPSNSQHIHLRWKIAPWIPGNTVPWSVIWTPSAKGAEDTYSERRSQISAKRTEYARAAVAHPHAPRNGEKKRIAGQALVYTGIITGEDGRDMGFNVPQLRMGQAPWVRRPVGTKGPKTSIDL
jgi:hypothetical protein